MKKIFLSSLIVLSLGLFCACQGQAPQGNVEPTAPAASEVDVPSDAAAQLQIVSGSENKVLEPILEAFTQTTGIEVEMTYMGSLDMMTAMGQEDFPYDAVWPASSLWLSVGEPAYPLKHTQSTSLTPVVFGIRESVAQDLGFAEGNVSVSQIVDAIRAQDLSFCMTSATQSNSGASAYIGFLYALAGHPDVLTSEHLAQPSLQTDIQDLLAGVDRSSGSSDWLKDMFLKSDFDAMVNYETLIIDANKTLEEEGRETLHVVYPEDGMTVADSPLALVDIGAEDKEAAFLALQDYLMSPEVQDQIQRTGRRTGYTGVSDDNLDVFRAEWGVEADRELTPIPMPQEDVLMEALRLYQSEFRKPSLAVYCLDYSGSMAGPGQEQMEMALEEIFNQDKAQGHLLQASTGDVSIVIPFHHDVIDVLQGQGPQGHEDLLAQIKANYSANGGTNLYAALTRGLQELDQWPTEDYTVAFVVMSDGESLDYYDLFEMNYQAAGQGQPIFSIMFGSAQEDQLQDLADLSNGRVFDGRTDLVQAFKSVKGYY